MFCDLFNRYMGSRTVGRLLAGGEISPVYTPLFGVRLIGPGLNGNKFKSN